MPIYTNDPCNDSTTPFGIPLVSSIGINPKVTKAIDSATKDWLDDHPEATTTVKDNSLTNVKFMDGSVNSRVIEDESITTDDIADLAVTTPKIADNAVTANKIASAAVDGLRTMSTTQPGVAKVGAGLAINDGALELNGGDIAPAVTAWLNTHPEATTTVQDNSLDGSTKLIDNSVPDSKLVQTGGVLSDLAAFKDGDCYIPVTWESGTIDNSGAEEANATYIRSGYIDVTTNVIKSIVTAQSTLVAWFFYDASQVFLARQSSTIDGTAAFSINTTAKYVRFVITVAKKSGFRIVKDTPITATNSRLSTVVESHNAFVDGSSWYVPEWSVGHIDSSGIETVNNLWMRTGFIDLSEVDFDYIYKSAATTAYLFEYGSDQSFIKRDTLSVSGRNVLTLDSNTAYIRVATPKSVDTRIMVKPPYTQKRDTSVLMRGADNISLKCVHHDNFSRTMTGWEIGKNSEGALTDNSYNLVTGSTDDGVRVDNGLTIAADNTRPAFTLRQVAAAHSSNFMVEFNAPESGKRLMIAYALNDATDFDGIDVSYNGTYYQFGKRAVQNGQYKQSVITNVYNSTGEVIQLYFLGGVVSAYIDDKFVAEFEVGNVDDRISFGAYNSSSAKLDFLNVFDVITPLVYNTEYLTDSGVSTLPNSTLSANENRYALDGTITRFSERSEKFMLYSTDEKISNGRRTERSLVALLPNNLRTMRYEFDVYFPSSILPDTDTSGYGDIFFQLHDRQDGVARGAVPFHLTLAGNKIKLTQCASAEQAAETLDTIVSRFDCGEVTYDQWMHFDFYIKERYEVEQHPFMELRIDGKVVYQSHKPNCANDVKGTSAQYGEYKNNFDLITYSERYIDNFKVTY